MIFPWVKKTKLTGNIVLKQIVDPLQELGTPDVAQMTWTTTVPKSGFHLESDGVCMVTRESNDWFIQVLLLIAPYRYIRKKKWKYLLKLNFGLIGKIIA